MFETTRQEAVEWFAAPDAKVSVNLRDVCDARTREGAARRFTLADGSMNQSIPSLAL